MKRIAIGLAFCSCLFLGLSYFIGFGKSVNPSGPLPLHIRAFVAFGIVCCIATVLALFRTVPAALLIWIAAIAFCLYDLRHSPSWMVQDDIFRFALWPVLFLTIAGWADEHKQPVR